MLYILSGLGARMTITPSVVDVVGSGSTTNTPSTQTVVLECSAQGLAGTIFSMYIRRHDRPLAEIAVGTTSQPVLSPGRPSEVDSKQPTLDGNVNIGSSSYLRVTYLRDRLDCSDGVQYHCNIFYKPTSGDTRNTSDSASLTVRGRCGHS